MTKFEYFLEGYNSEPNYSGFILIGAGLPRTGTASLRAALSQILDGPIYHMAQVALITPEDTNFWIEACGNSKTEQEWNYFLQKRGFRGGVDFPISLFYKDLMEAFPNAKVLLSVRDAKSWYVSVRDTVYEHYVNFSSFPCNLYAWLCGQSSNRKMLEKLMTKDGNRFAKGLFETIANGEEESVRFFNEWVEEVQQHVPKERLLVFNVKEGWEPLCKFLDVAIPEGPFPKINETNEIRKRFRKQKHTAYATIVGIPLVMSALFVIVKLWKRD